MAGISSRHDSHHVAQKLRNTTLPRKSLSETFLPPGSSSVKSGARHALLHLLQLGNERRSRLALPPRLRGGPPQQKRQSGQHATAGRRCYVRFTCSHLLVASSPPRSALRSTPAARSGCEHFLVADDALLVDDELGALREPALGVEHAVGLARLPVRRIGEQRKIELEEIRERLLREADVRADADDLGVDRLRTSNSRPDWTTVP